MKILRQNILTQEFRKLYGQFIGKKIKYFWNLAKSEHPELMLCLPLAITGLCAGLYSQVLRYKQQDLMPKYYEEIVIYRPGDPRIETIRKDETLRGIQYR